MSTVNMRDNIFVQPLENVTALNEENCSEDEEDGGNQVTPQCIIDSLSRYTIRTNGAYLKIDCFCGICYSKYHVGDKIICLPCQHNFHEHCIENWLKWVKSTCPVDKKTVYRRQYMQDVVNERRKRLLEAHALNEINVEPASSEEKGASVFSDHEVKFLDDNIGKKESLKESLKKKQGCRDIPEAYLVCTPKFISPGVKMHIKSNAKFDESVSPLSVKGLTKTDAKLGESLASINPSPIASSGKHATPRKGNGEDLEGNEKNQVIIGAFPNKYPQQLRDSVDAIRRSIKANGSRVKKFENSKKFQEALDSTICDLSDVRIYSPKRMSNNHYKSGNLGNFVRNISPSKSKENFENISLRGILGKRSFTFGEMVETENEVDCCWIYKGNNRHTLPKK